ncbi:MAG: NUDIX hydrolase [Pseudomonadota bacterium]
MSGDTPSSAPFDRPRIGVGVVVWSDDRVLLIQRGKSPGKGEWSLPGGSQELGETLFEAAAREVLEETGLTVRPAAILTAVDNIVRDPDGAIAYHYTIIDVLAELVGGEVTPGDDAQDARWANLAEMKQLVAWPQTREVIERSRLDRAQKLAAPVQGAAESL